MGDRKEIPKGFVRLKSFNFKEKDLNTKNHMKEEPSRFVLSKSRIDWVLLDADTQ